MLLAHVCGGEDLPTRRRPLRDTYLIGQCHMLYLHYGSARVAMLNYFTMVLGQLSFQAGVVHEFD